MKQEEKLKQTALKEMNCQNETLNLPECDKNWISQLSNDYEVRILQEEDVSEILELCQSNPLYYHHCPPLVTAQSIIEDLHALPQGKTSCDKYYLGFYEHHQLSAVLDLITRYPNDQTAFIGFFMMHQTIQNQGKGSALIEEICTCLKQKFQFVRLGYVTTNPQAKHFWHKNHFEPIGIVIHHELYDVEVLCRTL